MRILVTGGAGFIGSHLTEELLKHGHTVTVLDDLRNGSKENLKDLFSNKRFKFIEGDILKPKTCHRAAGEAQTIYHLACLGVRHSLHSPLENHRVNAEGTLNMLEVVRQKKSRFFYVSSSEIYGAADEFPIREETLPNPTTVYGAGKLAGEHYTNAYHRSFGSKTTILRLFNNYGPRAHYEGDAGEMIPRAIVNILYGKSPVLFGDGKNTRDFFYVKDTVRAFTQLLKVDRLEGETLNIGAGLEISMKDLLGEIFSLMGETKLKPKHLKARPGDLPRLWVDKKKFERLTGFKPAYSLREGLIQTIDYYRNLMRSKNLLSKIKTVNWEI